MLQVVGSSQARILYSDQKGRIAIALAFNKAIAEEKLKVIKNVLDIVRLSALCFYFVCIIYLWHFFSNFHFCFCFLRMCLNLS